MEVTVSALDRLGCAAIVSTGGWVAPEHFGRRPGRVRVVDHAPQRSLLARADLFVTHAGYTSVRESVRAGTPMVTIPARSQCAGQGPLARAEDRRAPHGAGAVRPTRRLVGPTSHRLRRPSRTPGGRRPGRPTVCFILGSVSLAHSHYEELHALVDRLRPERADEARRTLLRLVQGDGQRARLRALPVFDGPEDLSERVDEHLFGAPEPRC
jgi:hypothetical protein